MSIYKVTEQYLKILNQSFQTKQMQWATLTLKTVDTQWAHTNMHSPGLRRPENVSNSPIMRFFPSRQISQIPRRY